MFFLFMWHFDKCRLLLVFAILEMLVNVIWLYFLLAKGEEFLIGKGRTMKNAKYVNVVVERCSERVARCLCTRFKDILKEYTEEEGGTFTVTLKAPHININLTLNDGLKIGYSLYTIYIPYDEYWKISII